jgi:hypothetical protein
MQFIIEGCQLDCLDETVYNTDLGVGELFVSRGQLFTSREVERAVGECEYPKRFCKHFPDKGHPAFIFSEETAKPLNAKGCHKVIAIDGEKM